MTLSDDGAFYAMDDHHVRLFSLTNREQRPFTADSLRTSMIGGVTLGLDFPHTSNPIESFNQMVLLSKKLTQALSAKVVDDNQRPLNDASIEQIRQQLKKFLADMQSRGIEPGGAIAARLFS
jgi:FtsZ-interacting cell division protein ZipA